LSTSGLGIEDILEAIVHTLPPPVADSTLPLRALIFDSYYDAYRGVVVFFRVVDGEIRKGDKIRFMNSGVEYEVLEVGVMTPVQVKVDVLRYYYLTRVLLFAHSSTLCHFSSASIPHIYRLAKYGTHLTIQSNHSSECMHIIVYIIIKFTARLKITQDISFCT
jgi:hypothetical protein